jgi:hypothetical protein
MDREAAERECKRLKAEHPERATNTWVARETEAGVFDVVRVPLPPGMKRDPTQATVEAKPEPRDADDPRQSIFRNIPPYGAV